MDNVDNITDDINQNDNILKELEIKDEDAISASQEYTFTDLAEMVNTDNPNVTISGTYKFNPETDSDYVNGISIQKNSEFIIIGENAVIDGNGAARAFNILSPEARIILANITFINCYNEGNGGAILSESPIAIHYCIFNNNTAGLNGGAIYTSILAPCELSCAVTDSNFTNNKANNNYSAIYWKSITQNIFAYNHFKNHSNSQQTILGFEGNDTTFAIMNFINNSNKICMDLVGNNLYVAASNCYNNTGVSVRITGNKATFGGCTYDNSNLNNTDYAVIIRGDDINFGGLSVKSQKSIETYSNFTYFGGGTFSGEVVCHGYVYGGGFHAGDVILEGDSFLGGCVINGDLTSNGVASINGVTVGNNLILNNDAEIDQGTFNTIYNNNHNLNITRYDNGFNLVNNGGLVNLSNTDLTNCSFTNNGGVITSTVVDSYPTLTNCSFVNNGGELDFNIVLLDNNEFTNNKGTLNFENCYINKGEIVNYDTININLGLNENCNLVNNKGTMNIINSSSNSVNIDNKAKMTINGGNLNNVKLSNTGDISLVNVDSSAIVINKVDATVSAAKVTMNYGATKYVTIKITDKQGNPAKNVKFTVTINKHKYYATSNANGIAKVKIPALNVGTYKVTISGANEYYNIKNAQTTIKVNKAKTTVKLAKTVKKSKKLKITVKSKVTKKAAKSIKIKVKVYTGKKAKIYKLKTNKKGVAQLKTSKLTKGKHKLVITSLNKNYKISKKITIKVK